MANIIEFISPFPISTCADRIESQREEFQFFSFDWQYRVHTKVWPDGNDRLKFVMKKVQRNSLFSWGAMSEVTGFLKPYSEEKTVVIAERRMNWLLLGFSIAIFAFATVAFIVGLFADGTLATENLPLALAAALAVDGILFGINYFWGWNQSMELENKLKRILGEGNFQGF